MLTLILFAASRPEPTSTATNSTYAAQNTFIQHTPSTYAPQSSTERPSAFVPSVARAHSQTFFRHSSDYEGPRPSSQALPEQYAATVRGGGPRMFDDYAIEGEDLDWTKVTDPRERKRLQNIINGRKYRERRLAAEAEQQVLGPDGSLMAGGGDYGSPGGSMGPDGYGMMMGGGRGSMTPI